MCSGSLNLQWFLLLTPPKADEVKVSEEETKSLNYIQHCLFHDGRQPTVRGVAEAIGKRSSRSGYKMLQSLLKRGLIWKGADNKISMHKWCHNKHERPVKQI